MAKEEMTKLLEDAISAGEKVCPEGIDDKVLAALIIADSNNRIAKSNMRIAHSNSEIALKIQLLASEVRQAS